MVSSEHPINWGKEREGMEIEFFLKMRGKDIFFLVG